MAELTQWNRQLTVSKEGHESLILAVISSAVHEEGPGYLETESGRWWLGILGMDVESVLGYIRRLESVAS